MRRREFMMLVGGAAAAWSHGAQARRQAIPLIGFVGRGRGPTAADQAFREGLAEMGFTDGQNVAIEYRWTHGHLERLPKLMVDLVRRPVSAIFTAGGDVPALIAKGATRSIPIVFLTASDPVRSGLVASLNRPGLNATGVTMLAGPLGAKRLQLLRELVPNASAVGLLVNPNNTNSELESADVQAGGRTIGLQTHLLEASTSEEVDKAFASLTELKASALVVNADPLFIQLRSQFIALAARYSVPTIYYAR